MFTGRVLILGAVVGTAGALRYYFTQSPLPILPAKLESRPQVSKVISDPSPRKDQATKEPSVIKQAAGLLRGSNKGEAKTYDDASLRKQEVIITALFNFLKSNESVLSPLLRKASQSVYDEFKRNDVRIESNMSKTHASMFQDSLQTPLGDNFDDREPDEFSRQASAQRTLLSLLRVVEKFLSSELPKGKSYSQLLRALLEISEIDYSSSFVKYMCAITIGRILCSLTIQEEGRNAIKRCKPILDLTHKWENSEIYFLKLLSSKILWNLHQPGALIPRGVYIHNPQQSMLSSHLDIVFVHGLNGSSFYTWRKSIKAVNTDESVKFNCCWPCNWLEPDIPLGSRIILLDFSAPGFSSKKDLDSPEEILLESRAEEFLSKLNSIGVGEKPTIFIGHSLGGLIIKQMLVSAAEMRSSLNKNVNGIVFLSTPHLGSPIAVKLSKIPEKLFKPSSLLLELSDTKKLMFLNFEFIKLLLNRSFECLSICESLPTNFGMGINITIVPLFSAYPGYGRILVLKTDHLHISKPLDKDDPLYIAIKKFVLNTMPGEEAPKEYPPYYVSETEQLDSFLYRELHFFLRRYCASRRK